MSDLNKYIDHTLLKPDATFDDIKKLCKEASEYKFASICIAPCWMDERLEDIVGVINTCVVIGFPHGNIATHDKIRTILSAGADENDIVINIGNIKSGLWDDVENEIQTIRRSAESYLLKYIVEVGYLTDAELFRVADLLIKYKIDFIKTCTGYGPRNVSVDDIKKIKAYVGDRIQIKASGGIKSRTFAEDLIAAGANRLGTSSGVAIMENKPLNFGPSNDNKTY